MNFYFAYLTFPSVSGPKARFAIFNFSEKVLNIFGIGLKTYRVIEEKLLSEKPYLEIKNLQIQLTCLDIHLI